MNTPAALTLDLLGKDVLALLGDDDIDHIDPDENLFDLGLDSMRVLALVMKWGKTGIPLEFSHLAEHATLNGWWQAISAMQDAATPGSTSVEQARTS